MKPTTDQIKKLLGDLDALATGEDSYEYGLPIYNGPATERMHALVKAWAEETETHAEPPPSLYADGAEVARLVMQNFREEQNEAKTELAILRLINEAHQQGVDSGEQRIRELTAAVAQHVETINALLRRREKKND